MKNSLICAALAALCSVADSQRVSTTVVLSPAFATGAGPLGGSGATGVVDVAVDMTAKTVLLRARLLGLRTAVTVAHFHGAANYDIGESRPPVTGAAIDTSLWTTAAGQLITAVPDATLNLIMNGQTYLNVHTTAYGNGELAGPVAFEGVGIAHLMPSQETTRLATSTRYGVGMVKLVGSRLTGSVVSTGFTLDEVSAIHIHGPADIGADAGAWCLIATTATNGTVRNFTCPTVTDAIRTDLLEGRYYFNVHTAAATAGEIRGQIVFPSTLDGGNVLMSNITGAGVVGRAGTTSTGTGTGLVLFYKGSFTRGVAVLSATGLTGTMTNSHVHGPGQGVMFQLPQVQPAYAYQPFSVTTDQTAALVDGRMNTTSAYFNVHTTFATGGEINGYIQRLPNLPSSGAAAPTLSMAVALATAAVTIFAAANAA